MKDALKVLLLTALLGSAVAVALALEPEASCCVAAVECATGEASSNPVNVDGDEEPIRRDFDTLEEAEAFLCTRLPYPRTTNGWKFIGVVASRSHSLEHFDEGEFTSQEGGYMQASLGFMHESDRSYGLGFDIYPAEWIGEIGGTGTCRDIPETAQEIPIQIQGQDVIFYRDTGIEGEPYIVGCWEAGDLRFFVFTEFWGEPDLQPEIVNLLESIE